LRFWVCGSGFGVLGGGWGVTGVLSWSEGPPPNRSCGWGLVAGLSAGCGAENLRFGFRVHRNQVAGGNKPVLEAFILRVGFTNPM